MIGLPKELKQHAIQEAIFEIRFNSKEWPEVLLGRLLNAEEWGPYNRNRLPVADVPQTLREQDGNLIYHPLYELTLNQEKLEVVKIGPRVISLHLVDHYTGWDVFKSRIKFLIEFIFKECPKIEIERLGLRYINALNHKDHHINSAHDLEMEIKVRGQRPSEDISLTYVTSNESGTLTRVAIASPQYVQANRPINATVFIDVDVYTPPDLSIHGKGDIFKLLDVAHNDEKEAFFKHIPDQLIDKMRKD